MNSEVRNVRQTAQLLQVSERTIFNLVRRGELHPFRVGNRLRFHQDELDRFMRAGSEVAS